MGGWVLVTAWNPGGQRRAAELNAAAQRELTATLREAGFTPLAFVNGEGDWAEPAFLVPGASLRDALTWGQAFGQAATLFGVGQRAALVWTDGRRERCWAGIDPSS